MTTWYPDTCKCVVEISDDEATRGQPVKHIMVCDAHSDLAYDHKDVLEENQVKNKAINQAEELYPDAKFVWSFDDTDRTVVLTCVDGLVSDKDKQDLAAAVDAKLQDDLGDRYEADWVRVV